MRVVSYNIQYCKGRDGKIDPQRVVEAVQEADIIGFQEVDKAAARTGFIDQPQVLGDGFSDYFWVYGPTVDALSRHHPRGNERRQFGNMIVSRWPIVQSRNLLYTPRFGGANHLSVQLGLLETVIITPDGPLRAYCTHLHHLSPMLRLKQIEQLKQHLLEAPFEGSVISGSAGQDWSEGIDEHEVPFDALFFGDFNLKPGSPEYEALVGTPHPHDPSSRLLTIDGLADTWVVAGNKEEDGVSLIRDFNTGTGLRIDYVFATAKLSRKVVRAWIDSEAVASDHQPYWVEFASLLFD